MLNNCTNEMRPHVNDGMDYSAQAAFIFTATQDFEGLATLPAPNHVYMFMRHRSNTLYINPSADMCVMDVRYLKDLKFEIPKICESNKSIPESRFQNVVSRRNQFFSENFPCAQEPVQFLPTKQLGCRRIKPENESYLYYYFLNYYVKKLNPIAVYDVRVFQEPTNKNEQYGKPMYCHNMLANMMGLDLNTILTTKDLKDRLAKYSGKTNFETHVLWERELNNIEKRLGHG